jgi:hypothetical protein
MPRSITKESTTKASTKTEFATTSTKPIFVRVIWLDEQGKNEKHIADLPVNGMLQVCRQFEQDLKSLDHVDSQPDIVLFKLPSTRVFSYHACQAYFDWLGDLKLPLPKGAELEKMPVDAKWNIVHWIGVFEVM